MSAPPRARRRGVDAVVRDARRIVTLALIERPHPAHDMVSQAIEILAERGMVITPEAADVHRETAEQLDALQQVIELVLLHDAAGEAIDCDRLRVALRDCRLVPGEGQRRPKGPLTRCQLNAVIGAARGETAQETAARLGVAVDTVRSHRIRAFARLGRSTAAGAVAVAMATGLITPGDIRAGGRP